MFPQMRARCKLLLGEAILTRPGEGRGPGAGGCILKAGYVYIMASGKNGTIYIGVTSDLVKRVWEHRNGAVEGFTKKYGCKVLVWFEAYDDLQEARWRELQMKEWKRAWKIRLIEERNLDWEDLYPELL